jgi:uncharacterized protein YqeY
MTGSSIKDRLGADIKAAMKAGEKERLGALRMIHAAIRQREVDERLELDDAATLEVLDKQAKQHRESLEQYRNAGREDLAAREEAELAIIAEYLPEPLSETELDALIEAALSETGATSMKDMGRVMAALKPRAQGRADMGSVSARVKARLG